MKITGEERCPVCAMRVGDHLRSAAVIEVVGGRTFAFCGTGCMIRSWLHPEIHLKVTKKDIEQALVQEYFTGKPLDALQALFVAGSDVLGPMGPALVPLNDKRTVEVFIKRHGGRQVFHLVDLDDRRWDDLMGKRGAGLRANL